MDDDLARRAAPDVASAVPVDWTSDPGVGADPRAAAGRRAGRPGAAQAAGHSAPSTCSSLWLVGTALLLFGIAALFMRNQVRGIRRLAVAAEAFGMGRDPGPIRPEGAVEVRQRRRRLQPDAGAHPPLPAAAHRNAGRRVARSAHAADPPAPRARHAAGARGTGRGHRRDDRRRRGDGAHDRGLPRLRPRRGHRTGRTRRPRHAAGGSRCRGPPRGGDRDARRAGAA